MGQAKLFKRLRKEAQYKWVPQGIRQYLNHGTGWLCTGSRAVYRKLKAALK